MNPKNIQAGILKGHGRNHSRFIFLHFSRPMEDVIEWIRRFVRPFITYTDKQRRDSNRYKYNHNYNDSEGVFNFLLTNKGFTHLGLNAPNAKDGRRENAFERGMNSDETNKILNDTPSEWDEEYTDKNRPIHALIAISSDSVRLLNEHTNIIDENFVKNGIGEIVKIEQGTKLIANGQQIEHFGYADGITSERFFNNRGELDKEKSKIVLVPDEFGGHGSYMVFRKLEQNVSLFHRQIETIGHSIGGANFAGAQVVGRFQNGMPLTLSDNPYGNPFDFNVEKVHKKNKCPFHSHIRRANPRDGNSPKLVRRGIPYDYIGRGNNLDYKPSGGVGLLFICYQDDIETKFEAIQNKLNGSNEDIHDPLAGQPSENIAPKNYSWINKSKPKKKNLFKCMFQKTVTMRGGAYLYAPSRQFIEKLTSSELEIHNRPVRPDIMDKFRRKMNNGRHRYNNHRWNLLNRYFSKY